MSDRQKILVLIDWYLPAFKAGGQIRSCANLILALKKYFDFSIITRDRDINAAEPLKNIVPNEWTHIHDDVDIYYLSSEKLNYSHLTTLLSENEFDVLYLNSMFSYYFTILPIIIGKKLSRQRSLKIVLAVSGMLSPQALSIKTFKKKVFLLLAKMFSLYKNVTLVASSEIEKKDIQNILGDKVEIEIGPNLPNPVIPELPSRAKQSEILKLVYMSRIHPIKNLHKVLNFLSSIDTKYRVHFDIFGPIEDVKYWSECLATIAKLPDNIICTYKKVVNTDETIATYGNYHFSILPSESENFGYSIIESLSASCPVIISDNTPWQNLSDKQAGFDISLSEESKFIEAIEFACSMDQTEYNRWLAGTHEFATAIVNDEKRMNENRRIFLVA